MEKKEKESNGWQLCLAIIIMANVLGGLATSFPALAGYIGGIILSFTFAYGVVMVFVWKSNDAGDSKGVFKDFSDHKMTKINAKKK